MAKQYSDALLGKDQDELAKEAANTTLHGVVKELGRKLAYAAKCKATARKQTKA